MKKWGKRILLGGTALLAVTFGLVIWLLSAWPESIPVPQPNGVDEIIRLAGTLPKMPEGPNYTAAPESEIRNWIASTPNFRHEITNLLKMEFLVRTTHSNIQSGASFTFIRALRDLEGRLLAEAKDASRPAEERLAVCLQTYELGSKATTGGAMIDGMVSAAVRVNSLQKLSACSSNATSQHLVASANDLFRLSKNAPTTGDFLDGETFYESTVPLKARLEAWIDELKDGDMTRLLRGLAGSLESKMQQVNRIEVGTIRDLVVRSYTMDKGSPPTNWSDLIPTYLPAPLVDPVGKTNLSLIPGTTYQLSSE